MNHSFIPSQLDKEKCGICKYNFLQHSAMAECQACKNIGFVNPVKTILMCEACETKEIELTLEMNKPENVAARLANAQAAFTVGNTNGNDNKKVNAISQEASRILHNEISVREDIFNAQAQSIYALDLKLHADSSITNPNYVLAETLLAHVKAFQDVIFNANAAVVKAGNEQQATIVYLNQMANRLRVEEREKLKIEDINYKPQPPKLARVGKVKTTSNGEDKPKKPAKKKYNLKQAELHMLMKATGKPGHIIALWNIQGMSPDQILRKHAEDMEAINKAKSMASLPIPNPNNIPGINTENVKPISTDDEVVDMDELEGN